MREVIQQILKTFDTTVGDTTLPKTRVLLTAPQGANVHNPLDDPCTASLARKLELAVREKLHVPCKCIVASVSRTEYDQNRLSSMVKGEKDVTKSLMNHIRGSHPNGLRDTLHIDVHSFTVTDSANTVHPLPPNWGYGINILHLKGDVTQKAMAHRMKAILDRNLPSSLLDPATVVEHDGRPDHLHDDDSNAMMELCRQHGAMSLLFEFPTKLEDDFRTYTTVCSEESLVEAVILALKGELEHYR